MNGGCDGYSLRSAQLEHRLHVLAEEGGFDGHLIGQIAVDDAGYAVEDLAQPEIGIALFAHVDDAHHHQFGLVADDADYAIAHHVGSGVNAENDLLCIRFLDHR